MRRSIITFTIAATLGTSSNRIMILNNVFQHNCCIIQGSYIGYMFRLTDQSSSGLFSRLSHKVLCTHCDPSVCKGKGNSVPLQVWTGPEGSRKLRFPDFVTTAQDGGKAVSLTHRPPLPPANIPGIHFC